MIVRDKLTRGEFNHMSQVTQADGSVLVTLTRRGDPRQYILIVKDLYQPTESVISEEIKGE